MPKLLRRRFSGGGSSGGFTLAGKLYIPTAESTSSLAYTLLTTPDRIQNVVVPADALLMVLFQGLWQNTVANNARAAIFIGANQQKVVPGAGGAPGVIEAVGPVTANSDGAFATTSIGLQGNNNAGATTEVTTGQVIAPNSSGGGAAFLMVAAGTYDISVQYKNTGAGSLTAKNRHLWVGVFS